MATQVTVAFIDQIINIINKNYLAKSGMSLQRGGAYGRKQLYLVDNADYARTGGVEKQLCSGSAGEVYNYLKGMEELGDILFRIAPYRKANRAKSNPTNSSRVTVGDLRTAPRGSMLYCDKCGEENSATYGDYFMAPDDHVFKHCGRNMRLVTKGTVYATVARQTGSMKR